MMVTDYSLLSLSAFLAGLGLYDLAALNGPVKQIMGLHLLRIFFPIPLCLLAYGVGMP